MNFFSNWFLAPKFQIELKPQLGVDNIQIQMFLEKEIDVQSQDYLFVKNLFGEVKHNTLYLCDLTGAKYLYLVGLNSVKKLSHYKPGLAHTVCSMGSILCVQLLSIVKEEKSYFISLSQELKNFIDKEEFEFFLGLLQRSVSNKIKKIDAKQKRVSLFFSAEMFSDEMINKAISISDSMCITRTLINMPPNELRPENYENILQFYIKNYGEQIQLDVIHYEKLKELGCNLICAVGQGSDSKPRILKLTYTPNSNLSLLKHVSLVGKGITFDTGGYDMKTSAGMRIMKKDMGGSAAALGIFFACAKLNLPVKLSCYLAIAENMVSGNAMRPGDIYKTRSGIHVEIENTDAEGRLVLADAMSLACEEKPNWLIDLATLTGAARISLGPMIDSLYGNNITTSELLVDTGIENGDWVWQMPLLSEYETYLDSSVADCMNASASSFAGSATAALFLQKFVSVDSWNHIDTYMWCDKANFLWHEGSSPTGKCVRLVTRAIEKFIFKEDNKN